MTQKARKFEWCADFKMIRRHERWEKEQIAKSKTKYSAEQVEKMKRFLKIS